MYFKLMAKRFTITQKSNVTKLFMNALSVNHNVCVYCKGEVRHITQFQFNDWPNGHLVPQSTGPLLQFLDDVGKCHDDSTETPLVVHCMYVNFIIIYLKRSHSLYIGVTVQYFFAYCTESSAYCTELRSNVH